VKSPDPNARSIAAHVLLRVMREGAFAAAALDAALDRFPEMEPRERALATEIGYGALRTARYLERRIGEGTPRGIGKLDDVTRAHLCVAGYQILFLDKVPHFAAVSEAVGRVRAERGERLASFANAVLRRLAERALRQPRPSMAEAVMSSAPAWLSEGLVAALGAEGARSFLAAAVPPPLGLRVRRQDRDTWLARLSQALPRARFVPGRVSPLSILAFSAGDPEKLPGHDDGELIVQEEGAQAVGLSLGARPGERVLDACAGRGNKTSLLLDLGAETHAADLHPKKLAALAAEHRRLGLLECPTYAVDWTVGTGDVEQGYDRVLVDAPCSGTGTLRRRPEVLIHREDPDLGALSDRQVRILVRAASRLRRGGILVYAVCSVLEREAEDVIRRANAEDPSLVPEVFPEGPVRDLAGDATSLRLLPHVHGTDGYFLACLRREP
jgi:16S rRNA (cytosine967-C5)-methyltransferase